MSGRLINTSGMDDNRAVAPVIGVVILFGFLILALSLYQVEIVPQQNAETEFQHSGEVRNDLVELRAGILQAGSIDQPQYQTVQLGTAYSTRTFTINPPSPAGTIRTTDPYPITISNNSGTPEGTITIPTRFIEYQPGYNELDRSPTWYDASVLYLDARDGGGGIAVIEDQALVDNGEVQITALQNEFRRSGTGQVTLELRPAKDVTDDVPEGDLTVTVPTRLSSGEYWNGADIPTEVYGGVSAPNDDGVHNLTLETTASNLTVDTVGVQEAPEEPTQNNNARIGGVDGGNENGGGNENDIVTEGDVTVEQNEEVNDITTDGDVTLRNGASADNIETEGDVTLNQNAETGNIETEGEVILRNGARAGDIATENDVTLEQNAEAGNIETEGEVILRNGARAGDITTDGDVTLEQNAEVGDIQTEGEVILGNGARAGDITTDGDVTLGQNASAGFIDAGGEVTLRQGATAENYPQ